MKCYKHVTVAHFCKGSAAAALMFAETVAGIVILARNTPSSDQQSIWIYCLAVTLYFGFATIVALGDLVIQHDKFTIVCVICASCYDVFAIVGGVLLHSYKSCTGAFDSCPELQSLFQFMVYFLLFSTPIPFVLIYHFVRRLKPTESQRV